MLEMLKDTEALGEPAMSVDPRRREGLATWPRLSVEFSYTVAGELRSMTLHDAAGSLRVVAGAEAIRREAALGRIAELILGSLKVS